ncbi:MULTISPECIES: hypothetical protein [Burkholderia]|uniref:hypothetical protein n=1 Tax=Burkholderia TaxID=32008 RepID=UPI000E65E679|nr:MULTISPECIES: hypothetical protein [Burkholderia]MCR5895517.1 hypothetical protein [Burkholderia sp. HAN2018]
MLKGITNPVSASGNGFTYEHRVAAVYASALVCEQSAQALEGRIVKRVALQRKASGEPMDDVIVDAQAPNSDVYRLSLQVKRTLTISSAASNVEFRAVIEAAFATVTSSTFDRRLHRVGVIVGQFTSAEALPAFVALCGEAAHQDASSFTHTYGTSGGVRIVTNEVKRKQYDAIAAIVAPLVASGHVAEEVHRLLSCFVPLEMKLGYPGAADESKAEQMIRNYLPDAEKARAHSFWMHMLDIVDLGASLRAELDRQKIVDRLNGQFTIPPAEGPRPAPAASLSSDQRRARKLLAVCGAFALLSTALGVWTTSRDRETATEAQTSVPVPGRNVLERQINLAKLIGATATDASDEFVVAIPFSRPALSRGSRSLEGMNDVYLSNASLLRPAKQDIVFGAGRCRMHGMVDWPDRAVLQGEATIDGIACTLENGDSYILEHDGAAPIGFMTEIGTPSSRTLSLIEDDKSVTLPVNHRYMVRFLSPIQALRFTDKSSISW